MSKTFKFIKDGYFGTQSILMSVGFEGESMSLGWYPVGQGYNPGSDRPDVIHPIPAGPLQLLVWTGSSPEKQVFVRHQDDPGALWQNDPQTTETINLAAGQMLTKVLTPKRAFMLIEFPDEVGGQIEAMGGVDRGPSTMRLLSDPLFLAMG